MTASGHRRAAVPRIEATRWRRRPGAGPTSRSPHTASSSSCRTRQSLSCSRRTTPRMSVDFPTPGPLPVIMIRRVGITRPTTPRRTRARARRATLIAGVAALAARALEAEQGALRHESSKPTRCSRKHSDNGYEPPSTLDRYVHPCVHGSTCVDERGVRRRGTAQRADRHLRLPAGPRGPSWSGRGAAARPTRLVVDVGCGSATYIKRLQGERPDLQLLPRRTRRRSRPAVRRPHRPCVRRRAARLGDSLLSDVAGANALGITSAWINRDHRTPTEPPTPWRMISSLEELSPLLQGRS